VALFLSRLARLASSSCDPPKNRDCSGAGAPEFGGIRLAGRMIRKSGKSDSTHLVVLETSGSPNDARLQAARHSKLQPPLSRSLVCTKGGSGELSRLQFLPRWQFWRRSRDYVPWLWQHQGRQLWSEYPSLDR
jgi:hypothetical protein